MSGRYKSSQTKFNNSMLYRKLRKARGVTQGLIQYKTNRKRQPDIEEVGTFNNIMHIWGTGDRLYKLADEHYGKPELWWIIAWYNGKPTEGHISVGDALYIPKPLDKVYGLLRM